MSAALALSAARGAVLEAIEALDLGRARVAHTKLVRAEVMLSPYLPDLREPRNAVVAAMRSVSDDHRQARVDVVRAERVIAERAAEFTPVRPPSSADVKAARKASGEFQAADVAAILAEGKP